MPSIITQIDVARKSQRMLGEDRMIYEVINPNLQRKEGRFKGLLYLSSGGCGSWLNLSLPFGWLEGQRKEITPRRQELFSSTETNGIKPMSLNLSAS